MAKLIKADVLPGLTRLLAEGGLTRVHPDAGDATSRAALETLAGLPSYEQVHAGDHERHVVLLCLLSAERLVGVEVARRAQLLFERALVLSERRGAPVVALQLAIYERDLPAQERSFVVSQARRVRLFTRRARVGTWAMALAEPALHHKRLPAWPAALGPQAMSALLQK